MQFGTWLRAARAAEQDRGVDHNKLACYASELTPYVQAHLADASRLLNRVYTGLPGSATQEERQRAFWEEGREDFISEIRAVLDHLGASLTAVGCTDKQLYLAGRHDESPHVYVCVACGKRADGFTVEPLILPAGVFVCSEECEDRYENGDVVNSTTGTMRLPVVTEKK